MVIVKNWEQVLASVRAALMRRGRTRQDADDLVQEAWVRLACYDHRQTVEKPEAFLMRTALNLSVDAYRKSKQQTEHGFRDDLALEDASPTVEATVLARERIARLSICISGLGEKTRRIFLAHRVDGLSCVEIARENHISVSSVEKHIAKASLAITLAMEGL